MAVVLPIQSRLDFNPMDNDYESRCQNDKDESSSAMFTNRESEKENSDDDAVSEEHQEQGTGNENKNCMDIGDCSNDCQAPSETLPLNESTAVVDSTTDNDADPNNNAEEEKPANASGDNSWVMIDEHGETKNDDDNSAFVSSIMAVDLASANQETNEDATATGEPVSNAVEAIVMDRETDCNEADMEIDGISTALATPMDADNDAESVDVSISPEAIVEEESPDTPSYGGLSNLGNTCYMASAIQLLCGLDSFPADLKSRIPPPNNNNNEDEEQSLRDALLDVMDRLGNGETVSPDDLKRCIDSRTSLFLGYRQQDSHEFLTTLLDIIDEDYKLKPKREEPMTTTESHDEDDHNEVVTDDENNEDQNETETILVEACHDENNETDCESHDDDDGSDRMLLESAQKKQKVIDHEPLIDQDEEQSLAVDAIETGEEIADAASIVKSKSYSDFQFSDIENLLHDKNDGPVGETSSSQTEASVPTNIIARQDEPKCKLAGGRMSTAGVELTRFAEEGGLDEDVQPTGVSLETATPQQQIVEGNDHETEEQDATEETVCSPVSSNFTTKVRVCLTCESCKFRRSKIETYLHLSLDISTGSNDDSNNNDADDEDEVCNLGCPSSSSIEEGLQRFFAPEKREIKCEKCFHTSALQTSEITQLPRNLLFHLKRFIVDVSPDYSSISYRKDQSSVLFAERMELQACDDDDDETEIFQSVHEDQERGIQAFLAQDCVYEPDAAYEIRSVVNHIGSSASCGHYTADAKRKLIPEEQTDENEDSSDDETQEPMMVQDREWIRFNDCYVSRISSKEAVSDASKTAYMIMYELV